MATRTEGGLPVLWDAPLVRKLDSAIQLKHHCPGNKLIALSTFRTIGARLIIIRINDLDARLCGSLSNKDVYLVLSTVFLAGPFQMSSTLEASFLGAEPEATSVYNRKKP